MSSGAVVSNRVVWENPSPTSSFAAQTIPIDLSGYRCVLVSCTGNGSVMIPVDGETYGAAYENMTGYPRYRAFKASDTGVVAGSGFSSTSPTASDQVNNNFVIPKKIIGIA